MSSSNRIRLEVIEIPQPCPADWGAMKTVTGELNGDQVRFCGHCQKHVYNVSEMSRDAAELFLAKHLGVTDSADEGHLCIRMYKRADGTAVTADCGNSWRSSVAKWSKRWGGPVGALCGLVLAVLGCEDKPAATMMGGSPPPATMPVILQGMLPAPRVLMGDVAIPPATRPTTQPATKPTTKPAMLMGKIAMPQQQREK